MGELKTEELAKLYEEELKERDLKCKEKLEHDRREFLIRLERNSGSVEATGVYGELLEGFRTGSWTKPSEFITKKMDWLFDGYIFRRHKAALCYAVDRSIDWVYSTSYLKRSFRSPVYDINRILGIIYEFHRKMTIDKDVEDILRLRLTDKERAHFENSLRWYSRGCSDMAVAYELERNNQGVIDAVCDMINGEGELPVQRFVLEGIVKSGNREMHELLGKLLLAARLQEGLRQSICECMDLGTVEAFRTILTVIAEHDLIRFSSVKRAVGVWLGMISPDANALERISNKSIELILECIDNREKAEEYLKCEDCMKIYIGLWSIGVYNADEAAERVVKLSKEGTHHQILTAGYFCANLDNQRLSHYLAKTVICEHKDEQDIVAVYMMYFMNRYRSVRMEQLKNATSYSGLVYDTLGEMEKSFETMRYIYDRIEGKSVEFSPCIFPWYSASLNKSRVIENMCYLAFYLQDTEKKDFLCGLLKECDADHRAQCTGMVLHSPETRLQRETLIGMLSDKESWTRKKAAEIVGKIELTATEYQQMEVLLRYKAEDMRATIIEFLYRQKEEQLLGTVERLLTDGKEEKRTAGLDIVLRLSKDENRQKEFRRAAEAVKKLEKPTPKEQVLINGIFETTSIGESVQREPLYEEGDRYVPKVSDCEFFRTAVTAFMEFFPESKLENQLYGNGEKSGLLQTIKDMFKKKDQAAESVQVAKSDCDSLHRLFVEHGTDEFRGYGGEVYTFSGSARCFTELLEDGKREVPGLPLWKKWYETGIASPERLVRMYVLLRARGKGMDFDEKARPYIVALFGEGFDELQTYQFKSQLHSIVVRLMEEYVSEENMNLLSIALGYWYVKCLPQEDVILPAVPPVHMQNYCREREAHFISHSQLGMWFGKLNCRNNEYLEEIFPLAISVKEKTFYRDIKKEESVRGYYPNNLRRQVEGPREYEMTDGVFSEPTVVPYLFAAYRGIISKRTMYEFFFRKENLGEALESVTMIASGFREQGKQVAGRSGYGRWRDHMRNHMMVPFSKDTKAQRFVDEVYEEMLAEVLSVELKRGDTETEYSGVIRRIGRIYGIENLVAILTAMGEDTIGSSGYNSPYSKKSCLSHLLGVCIPAEGDTAEKIKEILLKTGISEKRLIEAALYSPEWIPAIGDYLGCDGFLSACYYFMAHMNESFDDKRKAMIAKFTPLSEEELNDGAFDIHWFKSAYETLGKKQFEMIYDAAKYISDGTKHARARKYADAVLGKTDRTEAEQKISDKRNKDLLMAYSLIPLGDEADVIRTYLFLQQFLKESKKFGAQRIASEKKAVEIAMNNLAMNAGYSDVMRLTLRMETKLLDDMKELFAEKEIEDVTVRLSVEEDGRAEIVCTKDGKVLKSVPAKLKKQEYILRLNESKKKLTEQYKRTKLMFEQAMEDETEFTVDEIMTLHQNPVAKALIHNLVFVYGTRVGFLAENKLTDYAGVELYLNSDEKVRVAHPVHLYRDGHWPEYQKVLYEKKIIQPFKQVFRELYVKTEEELELNCSRRYSGNQIQPQKTVACLKGRRWVADVEDGLQKIYYKENIVVRIYALADWFSPSDIEAPTVESVEFYDRNNWKALKIKDIPEVIFSEVMRDVDLAVSVAHAGGVDPETSHSTVEMRAALLTCILPLLKLANVTVNKNHAIVEGAYGTYNINLGSGVIHKQGGAMIHVLPVHSQHRGKIFLPFVDEDPKTAEILTKVIFFAEDKKIKDVSILEQIR